MIFARQSTALEFSIGPVLDASGVAVTDCVVADFKLKKTTGNFAALNGSATLTHVSAGTYDLVLTTSDTDTVGVCSVAIDDTVNACMPVYMQVIEEAVYDAFYAASATGLLPTNVTQISGDSVAADNAEAFFDGTGYAGTNNVIPTVTNTTQVNGAATVVLTDGSLTAAKTAADYVTEIQTAITGGAYDLDTDANGRIRIVDGTAAGEINTNAGAIALVDLVTTLTTYTGNTPQTGDSFARIGANGASLSAVPWNAAWDAEVQSEVDDALVAQRLDELLNADSDIDGVAPPAVGSVFHELMSKTAGSFTFDQTTDSNEALRDRGDAAWATATGFSTLTDAQVWTYGTRNLTALGFNLAAGDFDAGAIDANALATDAVQEIRNAITGGAYALNTSATGSIRVVDGTSTDELDLSSGAIAVQAASIRSAVGLASANLDTQLDAIPTAAENAAGVLDLADAIETGLTLRQSIRLIAAATAAKVSGGGSSPVVFRNAVADSKNRITASVDASGNRSAITYDLTA